jgi:hypothetical protein
MKLKNGKNCLKIAQDREKLPKGTYYKALKTRKNACKSLVARTTTSHPTCVVWVYLAAVQLAKRSPECFLGGFSNHNNPITRPMVTDN